ncbi:MULTISPECIES: Cof-type HAD-IIB family hydrolase [unclassified Leptolyngbya]|uniref:Cof-type HAD-IIB family hydrolase n=1 Tax=unclassified Leptolyngbya TaxID=2650499 RepID=UPI001681F313|nr:MULTISPECIES: Cof-type HAD-IIB family hydrolase [unclassified Leptolyngbya]MBD1913147.1 HAD family phosphatase [Leptolyngbya sp. FACHB-8]MBD2158814.1 HAD family phosphatase [Leptolyngbya sp. FACHB-16]
MSSINSSKLPKISLLLADVDGTLVTKEKILTDRARVAVHKLRDANIRFAITSGRPPLGMKMIVETLKLTEPSAAFNGGLFVYPDFSTLEENVLSSTITQDVIKMIAAHHLDVWIYRGKDWYVHERHGSHVDREEWTVKFSPTVVSSFDNLLDSVVKIVGVSDDLDAVAKCEADIQQAFSQRVHCQARASSNGSEQVSAARSQPYYLDVTHPHANKGAVVDRLSQLLGIPRQEIATIGDMPNDVPMFERSGLSIAMGNASAEVQKQAQYVTTSYEDEGFANAVEQFILGNNAIDVPGNRLQSAV